ncbi:MAG: hypothetical protein R3E95_18120 [Thiolinea sp.]
MPGRIADAVAVPVVEFLLLQVVPMGKASAFSITSPLPDRLHSHCAVAGTEFLYVLGVMAQQGACIGWAAAGCILSGCAADDGHGVGGGVDAERQTGLFMLIKYAGAG